MNNESIKSTTISALLSNTTSSSNISSSSTSNIVVSATPSTAVSLSSPATALSSTFLQQQHQSAATYTSLSSSTSHIDATVNAITAAVNASSHLPAVAVSSLAAAIIPDTPIVSIAGSTLSEITTTTTSTRTTPTPVPTTKENTASNKQPKKDIVKRSTSASDSLTITNRQATLSSSSSSTASASVAKGQNPMSVANSSTVTGGAIPNATVTAPVTNTATSAADIVSDNDNVVRQTAQQHNSTTTTSPKCSSANELLIKQDSIAGPQTDVSSPSQTVCQANAVSKTDENATSTNENKTKVSQDTSLYI